MAHQPERTSSDHIKEGGLRIQQAVEHFHRTYNHPISRVTSWPSSERVTLRWDLIEEEFNELLESIALGDMVETADALGDLIYVIFGMAIELGIPMGYVLKEIQRSNMSKLDDEGKPIFREDGKVLKGPNFQEPDIDFVLRSAGRWAG